MIPIRSPLAQHSRIASHWLHPPSTDNGKLLDSNHWRSNPVTNIPDKSAHFLRPSSKYHCSNQQMSNWRRAKSRPWYWIHLGRHSCWISWFEMRPKVRSKCHDHLLHRDAWWYPTNWSIWNHPDLQSVLKSIAIVHEVTSSPITTHKKCDNSVHHNFDSSIALFPTDRFARPHRLTCPWRWIVFQWIYRTVTNCHFVPSGHYQTILI